MQKGDVVLRVALQHSAAAQNCQVTEAVWLLPLIVVLVVVGFAL